MLLNHFVQKIVTPQTGDTTNTSTTTEPLIDPLKDQITSMSLEEKIGSLLILGFRGTTLNEHITTLIEKHHVGGVNLLGWNILHREQTKKLTADLQNLYTKNHPLPFIISVDQEGGSVVRFKFLNEKTPQPAIRTIDQAKQVAETRAKELRSLGVNMNYAPVVDYITNKKSYLYNRTFATTTSGIRALAKVTADTYLQNGIMPVYKHFPGYGNSTINPHIATTKFDGSEAMFKDNINVFRSVLENEKIIPVMTAHIQVPWISDLPATKAKIFMTDILRTDFSYDGVIITDDLDMVSAGKNPGLSAVESIVAGADMIISTPNDTNHFVIIDAIKKAVEDGTISQERLDRSVERVIKMRQRLVK